MKLSELTKPELDRILENANFTEEEGRIFKTSFSEFYTKRNSCTIMCITKNT